MKCLENALDACLTYLHFPEEEWICLRTTNVIERVNKEFKRRTKPMNGDPWRREVLLSAPGFRLFENANELAVKTHRQTAPKPAFPQMIGRRNIHTIALTLPVHCFLPKAEKPASVE